MELLYSVGTVPTSSRRGKNAPKTERALGAENLCQISAGNVIAFSSGGGPEDGLDVASRGYHVFVADLNTPWDIHPVWSGGSPVSVLQWDAAGARLLVGHADGLLQLLEMRGHVVNSWRCLHSTRVDNEEIIQAAFFHNGKKISISAEKRDSFLYNDKFQSTIFSPTLRHFGGRPTDGFIGLTATGLLVVCCLNGNGAEATFKRCELTARRTFIRFASMCYSKGGSVMVACSSGVPDAPVTCHQVTLQQTLTETAVDVQQLPSVYMDCGAQPDSGVLAVTFVQYLHKEDGSQLLVGAGGDAGGVLELWRLGETPVSFSKVFKRAGGAESRVQTWIKSGQYQSPRPLASVATARLSLQDGGLPPSPLVVVTTDGGVVSLHRDSLIKLAAAVVEPAPRWQGEPPPKLARSAAAETAPRLTDVALSAAGHLAAVVDDHGHLYLYRLAADAGVMSAASSLALQLEYYMVCGLDVWEVLVGLRPPAAALDAVCDTLADSFHRQPAAVQQLFYVRHMAIKTSLYRLFAAGARRVADNNSVLMLRCVASALRALHRPADVSPLATDGEPSDTLNALMTSKPVEAVTEIDKVLAHLKEHDPGSVDAGSLSQVQHLVQWVADTCLLLLTALPESRQKQAGPLRERQSLLLLRELLVIVRRWGVQRPACLPVFQRHTDQADVVAACFKLLTKLLPTHAAEPDEALLTECSLLPSPGLTDHSALDLPSRGVLANYAVPNSTAKHYEFYDAEAAEIHATQRRHQEAYTVDSLRHLRLGAKPSSLKQCTRCLAVTSGRTPQQMALVKTAPVTRAWDQRWGRACLCGGHWVLTSSGGHHCRTAA